MLDQIKVPVRAWRCNVSLDQIDGLVVICPSTPAFAHAGHHPRRRGTRTNAARGCLSPRVLGRLAPFTRLGQSAVHLAACAIALAGATFNPLAVLELRFYDVDVSQDVRL